MEGDDLYLVVVFSLVMAVQCCLSIVSASEEFRHAQKLVKLLVKMSSCECLKTLLLLHLTDNHISLWPGFVTKYTHVANLHVPFVYFC